MVATGAVHLMRGSMGPCTLDQFFVSIREKFDHRSRNLEGHECTVLFPPKRVDNPCAEVNTRHDADDDAYHCNIYSACGSTNDWNSLTFSSQRE